MPALVTIPNRLDARLTSLWFWERSIPQLVVGDTWRMRWRYAEDEESVSLEDATIVWTLTSPDSQKTLVRTSGVAIEGTEAEEIELDAEGEEEGEEELTDEDGNPIGGRGWFTLKAEPTDLELEVFTPFVGLCPFEIAVAFPDGTQRTFVRGVFEILAARGNRPIEQE